MRAHRVHCSYLSSTILTTERVQTELKGKKTVLLPLYNPGHSTRDIYTKIYPHPAPPPPPSTPMEC